VGSAAQRLRKKGRLIEQSNRKKRKWGEFRRLKSKRDGAAAVERGEQRLARVGRKTRPSLAHEGVKGTVTAIKETAMATRD